MLIIWLVVAAIIGGFAATLLVGAPYLPTRRLQSEQAFELLELLPNQVFYDLGCGDGRLLRAAAKRGAKAVGYELNPILFLIAFVICLPSRGRIKVKFGNFWRADLRDADAIFIFLLDKYMSQFDKYMSRQLFKKPVRLVSYAFAIPGKKPLQQAGPMYLYKY